MNFHTLLLTNIGTTAYLVTIFCFALVELWDCSAASLPQSTDQVDANSKHSNHFVCIKHVTAVVDIWWYLFYCEVRIAVEYNVSDWVEVKVLHLELVKSLETSKLWMDGWLQLLQVCWYWQVVCPFRLIIWSRGKKEVGRQLVRQACVVGLVWLVNLHCEFLWLSGSSLTSYRYSHVEFYVLFEAESCCAPYVSPAVIALNGTLHEKNNIVYRFSPHICDIKAVTLHVTWDIFTWCCDSRGHTFWRSAQCSMGIMLISVCHYMLIYMQHTATNWN